MKVMDRAGTPQDIAPAVVFLCSEGSAGYEVPILRAMAACLAM